MAEIRVGTPQSSTFTDSLRRPRQESQSSATIPLGSFADAEEPVLTVRFNDDKDFHSSLHSEPDVDTIMPLPGTRRQLQPSPLITRRKEDSDFSDEDDELLHTPTSIGFTKIDHPLIGHDIYGDDLTAKALDTCKKTVLHPYLVFLKLIGWRRFSPKRYDLEQPKWLSVVNVLWPTIMCMLIVGSCVTQILTCFRRDRIPFYPSRNVSATTNVTMYEISCERHILTTFVIPDILLISAFAYGLYIFRWVQTEQLSTLTEAVFLGHITRHGRHSHKRLTCTLQLLIILGILWILFSLASSVLRAYTLHLLDKRTNIEWITHFKYQQERITLTVRWVLVSITVVGFITLDIAYAAVLVNYCLQCQLLIYYFRNIGERIRSKEWSIDQAIKEIRNSRQFLSQLNSHLARAMSLLLFIVITSSIEAIVGLHRIDSSDTPSYMIAILGIMASFQWLSILTFPLIQAARVTRACSRLKKAATEVRSRPYSYADTAQLDLDSFVIFTSGLSMSAKLISIPVSPGLVAGIFFILGLTLFLVFQYDTYSWAVWL